MTYQTLKRGPPSACTAIINSFSKYEKNQNCLQISLLKAKSQKSKDIGFVIGAMGNCRPTSVPHRSSLRNPNHNEQPTK